MAYEVLRCPGCEFENHPSSNFCIGCGQGLAEVAPLVLETESVAELEPEGEAAPSPDARELLRKIVEASGYESAESGGGAKVTVPLDGDRRQKVHVFFTGKDRDGEDVVSFLSLAAPFAGAAAPALLELNAKLHYCRIATVTVQGRKVFGVMASQLASTADEAEVKKLLAEVARTADSLEAKLRKGEDKF